MIFMFSSTDKTILRELAKQYAEIAAHDTNIKRKARGQSNNSLRPTRPLVWMDEIPWHEMDIDGFLILQCIGDEARKMERHFRQTLYRWKYMQADMIVDDAYYIDKAFDNTGIGIEIREQTRSTDTHNHIISHLYEDILETDEQVEALRLPIITAQPKLDKIRVDEASEVLGDILPVKLRGHGIYHAPWDTISMLRGVEPILIDMIDNPEHLHNIRRKFMEIGLSQHEQMEAQGLLDFNIPSLHCTPPYADELPSSGYDGANVGLRDVWFRGMAQSFSTVSPAMWKEFDIDYMRPLSDKCGLVYYGCCEPLDNILDMLMDIPNMRKLGISPWADENKCAETLGAKYVYARKPNPAFVATNFDADIVHQETKTTIELCLKYGCPYEFVLKDISTVSYKPQNLISWVTTVMSTIDEYYGSE